MDKPILPKELSLSRAASELKLDIPTHTDAIKQLVQHAIHDGLKIYLNSNIFGYEADKSIENSLDPFGFPGMDIIDGDVTPISYLNGRIRFLSGSYDDSQEEPTYIAVSSFEQNDINYYSALEQGHVLNPSNHNEKDFYIYREDLHEFIDSMGNNEKALRNDEAGGVLKALAILAREYADKASKFKTGNKVNASAFTEHLLVKANEYGVSPHGLKSIDDKINKKLKELDLKDIPESDNS